MLGGGGRREAQPGKWLRRTFRIWGLGKKSETSLYLGSLTILPTSKRMTKASRMARMNQNCSDKL